VRTIGIFSVTLAGLDASLQGTAIDAIATAIGALPNLQAITRNEIDAMLSAEQMKDQLGCDDVTCLAEIGAAAGAKLIVSGTVSSVEGTLLVNLQLTNTEYVSIEHRISLSWQGPQTVLNDVLATAAEMLVLPGPTRQPGTLRLSGLPEGAGVLIDGEPRGVGNADIEGLSVGVHGLRIEAESYLPHQQPFLIRHGGVTQIDLQLTEEPPLYTKWWFWTGAGVLVIGAGAATAGLLLSDSGAPPPTTIEFTTARPVN
jgi:hypothetical protein